jgi:DnaJ like chaperone protein
MWFGKVIGGLIGFASGGPFGLIIGVIAGHYFDRALNTHRHTLRPQEKALIEETFFRTVFLLMGRMAKADGRVSAQEIAHTEHLMTRMALHSDHRRRAIDVFKEGTAGDFEIDAVVAEFRQVCSRHPALSQQLLNYLLSLSLADGTISANEELLLRQISSGLGFSSRLFEQLLRMVRAQSHFHHRDHGGFQPREASRDELQLAYEAMGVDESVSDTTLKKTYRKLMSENHPDKLTGQGMPEDMIKLATERAQEIQTAYELIKKHRSGT